MCYLCTRIFEGESNGVVVVVVRKQHEEEFETAEKMFVRVRGIDGALAPGQVRSMPLNRTDRVMWGTSLALQQPGALIDHMETGQNK